MHKYISAALHVSLLALAILVVPAALASSLNQTLAFA